MAHNRLEKSWAGCRHRGDIIEGAVWLEDDSATVVGDFPTDVLKVGPVCIRSAKKANCIWFDLWVLFIWTTDILEITFRFISSTWYWFGYLCSKILTWWRRAVWAWPFWRRRCRCWLETVSCHGSWGICRPKIRGPSGRGMNDLKFQNSYEHIPCKATRAREDHKKNWSRSKIKIRWNDLEGQDWRSCFKWSCQIKIICMILADQDHDLSMYCDLDLFSERSPLLDQWKWSFRSRSFLQMIWSFAPKISDLPKQPRWQNR